MNLVVSFLLIKCRKNHLECQNICINVLPPLFLVSNTISIVLYSLYVCAYVDILVHNPIILWNFGFKCVDKSTIYYIHLISLSPTLCLILSFSSFTTTYKMYLFCKWKTKENPTYLLLFIFRVQYFLHMHA